MAKPSRDQGFFVLGGGRRERLRMISENPNSSSNSRITTSIAANPRTSGPCGVMSP